MPDTEYIAARFLEELQHRALLEVGMRPETMEQIWDSSYRSTLGAMRAEELIQKLDSDFDTFEQYRRDERERLLADPQILERVSKAIPGFRLLTTEELAATVMQLSLSPDKTEAFLRLALPTRYEHPLFYRALLVTKPLVEKAIGKLGLTVDTTPLIGTLPHGEVHARLMPVPDIDRSLVLFNSGWFGFLLRAVPVLFRYMSWSQPDLQAEARRQIERLDRPELMILKELPPKEQVKGVARIDLLNIIVTYLLEGDPSKTVNYFDRLSQPRQLIVTTQWLMPIQCFVMSHEYGHLTLGHLDPASAMPARIGAAHYTVHTTNWDKEYAADATGFQITLKILESSPSSYFAGIAVDMYFVLVDILEKARAVLLTGSLPPETVGSYPPTRQRQQRIREWMLANSEPKIADYLKQVYQTFDSIHDNNWQGFAGIIKHMHQEGLRPAELWKRSLLHLYQD